MQHRRGEKVVKRSWPCIKVCVRCSRCSSLCKLRIRTRSDRAAACRTGNALCTHNTHKIVTSAPTAANSTSAAAVEIRAGDHLQAALRSASSDLPPLPQVQNRSVRALPLSDQQNDKRTGYRHKSMHTNGVREITVTHFLQLFPCITHRADFTSKCKHYTLREVLSEVFVDEHSDFDLDIAESLPN